jgi:prevent-host-death family protein
MLTEWRHPVAHVLGVGEAKRRFSELMSRVAYKQERFLVQRRGRPMVALVSPEELERLEHEPLAPKGLLAAIGAWAGYEELDQVVEDIYRQREAAQDRAVVLES